LDHVRDMNTLRRFDIINVLVIHSRTYAQAEFAEGDEIVTKLAKEEYVGLK